MHLQAANITGMQGRCLQSQAHHLHSTRQLSPLALRHELHTHSSLVSFCRPFEVTIS